MDSTKLKSRTKILLALLCIWAVIVTVRLFYYTVYARDYYLEKGNRIAWRRGVIPAARGRILAKNGLALAWTERHYDLFIEDFFQELSPHKELVLGELRKIFPNLSLNNIRSNACIRRGLKPPELADLSKTVSAFSGLRIIPRFERRYVDYPEVRELLGAVELVNGTFQGVKGIERDYDSYLSGADGIYLVMLDRNGDWIPGTWTIKSDMIPGKDLILEYSLEEIIKIKGRKNERE